MGIVSGDANVQGEIHSKAKHSHPKILGLATAFVGLGLHAGWFVTNHGRRRHFVAVLSPWPGTPQEMHFAFGSKLLERQGGGMVEDVWHGCIQQIHRV